MTTLHQLLARQLERLGIDAEALPSPASWCALLETVSQTYTEAAQERFTMEHALASSSRELRQLYDDLQHASDAELAGERDKLSKSVAIHEATLEASPDGVLIVSEDRYVVGYNQRLVELWDLNPELFASRDADRLLDAGLDKVVHREAYAERVRHLSEHLDESSVAEVLGSIFRFRLEAVR